MTERWKPAIGFEGFYAVSNKGRVKSLSRLVRYRYGLRSINGRILKNKPDKEGYMYVAFSVEGKQWVKKIHRLVCEVFNGPCPKNMQCRHLDGNRINNIPSNLKWGTSQEDANDRIRHGVAARGEGIGSSKLSEKDVLYILKSNKTKHELAKRFGVVATHIAKIKNRESWTHVNA